MLPAPNDWNAGAPLHHYVVCDVFAAAPLEGNQLAVFLDGRSFTAEEMQTITREMNFAETVFLFPPLTGGNVAVRIFTPRTELPFAGHPVLGTGFVVAMALGLDGVVLETGTGHVPLVFERDGPGGELVSGRMRQPIPSFAPFERAAELLSALRVPESGLPVEIYKNGPEHVFVNLPDEDAVAALKPDMAVLTDLGVAANCFAGSGTKWKTRMFYPAAGVAEDPATGSAAGPLAVHLARHGAIAFGEEIEITQGVEIKRPSVLYVWATGEGDRIDTVEVRGRTYVVAEGQLRIG